MEHNPKCRDYGAYRDSYSTYDYLMCGAFLIVAFTSCSAF